MSAEFYLFNVDHGQCAALRLPTGRWCVFDAGNTSSFSPIEWIAVKAVTSSHLVLPPRRQRSIAVFKIQKATISHFHGDHLSDSKNLLQRKPLRLRVPQLDPELRRDIRSSNSEESLPGILDFMNYTNKSFVRPTIPIAPVVPSIPFQPASSPDYGGVQIEEKAIPLATTRKIGGSAGSRVNNTSIVTRINVYGRSILICGDMEKDAWNYILNGHFGLSASWKKFVSNVDILVAPHHGHKTGYSIDLLNFATPAIVLVSIQSKDPNVDSRYSQSTVNGYISTRQKGHIKVTIEPPLIPSQRGMLRGHFGNDALE